MTALSQRMENSRAWWSAQTRQRNEERARNFSINLTAAFVIAVLTMGFVEALARQMP